MESENIIVKPEGAVTRITLNRPEKRNSLSHALMTDLITALKGVDSQVVVLEGAGGELGRTAFDTLAPGGWISTHGAPSGGFAPVDAERVARDRITVQGIAELRLSPEAARNAAERALEATAAGRIAPVIDRTYPLRELAAAHEAIADRSLLGKAIIAPQATASYG
jgi:NADPH2:quinone reductase